MVTNKIAEVIRPEIPPEDDAVAALVALANSFLPSVELSRLAGPPGITGTEAKAGIDVAQERYRLLIDQLPAATFMAWFENGRSELYVSSYIETLLGYTAAEWSENPTLWYQRLHPDERQRWNEEFSRTVASAQPFRGDYRFLARDGRVVWIHGEVKVIYDESGRPFMHGIGYDITELKLIEDGLRQSQEKEQRANRARSEFLTRTSHELRTPLNIIMGFAEFLTEAELDPLDPKRKEYLQEIYSSGKHLLRLIDDVLDLARVEAGKMDLRLEKFSVRVAVESVCAGAKTVALKRKIHIDVAVSPEIGEVTLDQQKFKQILYNLLSNAIKFTDPGGIVRIRILPQNANHFKLVVQDNGIGIRSEDMPRLFQDFEQLDSGPSRRYEGSGLGLALTKVLAELQGGTISVDSHHGVGTTVSVVLPKQIPG
jgi:PAS domain S-box-containing protein